MISADSDALRGFNGPSVPLDKTGSPSRIFPIFMKFDLFVVGQNMPVVFIDQNGHRTGRPARLDQLRNIGGESPRPFVFAVRSCVLRSIFVHYWLCQNVAAIRSRRWLETFGFPFR